MLFESALYAFAMRLLIAALAGFAVPAPGQAQAPLEQGFAGAVKGCSEWILNPASWIDDTAAFAKAVGLGDQMAPVRKVEEVNLPPRELRRGNRFWRINSTDGAGYILVVSDQLPMCHITGGGDTDIQPSVEAVLSSADFKRRWVAGESRADGDMLSTLFRSREDPALSIMISRASKPGGRLDRVQLVATAVYDTGI